jgi:hypothetical protein
MTISTPIPIPTTRANSRQRIVAVFILSYNFCLKSTLMTSYGKATGNGRLVDMEGLTNNMYLGTNSPGQRVKGRNESW